MEQGTRGGGYHGVAEEGMPFRQIAETIGHRVDVATVGLPVSEAAGHFSWFTHLASLDIPAARTRTRASLGWRPTGSGLLDDLEGRHYCNVSQQADRSREV